MRSMDVFFSLSMPPSSIPLLHSSTWLPLVCPLIWLSSLCQSVPFLSSSLSPLLIPSRWLSFSCVSSHHLSPLWVCFLPLSLSLFLILSPPSLFLFPLSNLARPVCLRFECPTLIFPTPLLLLAPPLLFPLFIYIERDGGRADRMDWWMVRGHGWGDLGVWWTLLSVSILLKKLACSLLLKRPSF